MARAEKDFVELLRLFNKFRVRYCIVGAFAVGFHALPRYTKDLDLLVEPAAANGEKICQALAAFGFGRLKITPEDFDQPGRFIQLGYEPVRVDLITSIKGVTFDQVWKHRRPGRYGTQRVWFIGLEELIDTKRAAGRAQDRVDVKLLQRALKQSKRSGYR